MRRVLTLVFCLGAASSFGISQFIDKGPPKDNSINVPTNTMSSNNQVGMRISAINPEPWPEGAAFVEGPSLPRDNNVPMYDPEENETVYPDGRRALAIKLAPGEKLSLKLASAHSKVAMRVFVPQPPPPLRWRMELLNANKIPRARRSSKLEIQNPTSDPQTLFLILYGEFGNSYRLDLERIAKK